MTQNTTKVALTVVILLVGLFAVSTQAAEQPAAAAAPEIGTFHNPTDWLEMGADIRWRWVYGYNLDTLKDDAGGGRGGEWHFTRNRFRWWTKSKLDEDITFNTRLTWEFRTWDNPQRKPQHVDFDEVLFDNFNISIKNFLDMPMTAVIGRQDIMLGKGWLVMDATPLDGSRTLFFDAARFTYNWEEAKTKLDMIYVDMGAASDRWLKPFNDRDRLVTEQDERGAILYLTNKSIQNTQLEGYFIYKNDNPADAIDPEDIPSAWSKKAEIYTFGGAIDGKINDNWRYRAEGAFQTGDKWISANDEQDLRAFGTTERLDYDFNDEKKNNLHVGYEYLSGDDPSTDKIEAFDPLWGEWPQWSELYGYTYTLETMPFETTNLHRFWFGHSFNITPKVQLATDYHFLWADENTRAGYTHSSGFGFSEDGSTRGQLLTCWLKWTLNKNLKGHLLGEWFWPGNYYSENSRDMAYFLRCNIEYTF